MKLTEIHTFDSRDEYIDQQLSKFYRAKSIAKLKDFILRKKVNGESIYYGLFSKKTLIAFLWLTKYDNTKYQSVMVIVHQDYRGQGLATFLFDYAVMNDNLTVLSDNGQTPDSKKMWLSFKQRGHFNIGVYSLNLNNLVDANEQDVYDPKNNLVWAALPTGKTINECLEDLNTRYKDIRRVEWYVQCGPDFYNW
jgi:GNAT superfamily N-acetyltransferase